MSIRQINRLKTLLNLNKSHTTLNQEEEQKLYATLLQEHLNRNDITFDDLDATTLPEGFKNLTSLIDTFNIDESKYECIASNQTKAQKPKPSLKIENDITPQQQVFKKSSMFDDHYLPINTHTLHYNFKTKRFTKPKSKTFVLSDILHNNQFTSDLKDQVEISTDRTTIDNTERFNNIVSFITLSYTKAFYNKYQKFGKQMNQNYISKNFHFIPVFLEIMQKNLESNNLKHYNEGVSKLLYIFERCLITTKDFLNKPTYFVNTDILQDEVSLEDKFSLTPADVLFKTLFLKIKYSFLKSEYISCSEFTKILFNFSYYYKSDLANYTEEYVELLEQCYAKEQTEEPFNRLLKLGNDPYFSALFTEIFALKLKEVNTLEQIFKLSTNSENICTFISPTLLYNLALGVKWFKDEDILSYKISSSKVNSNNTHKGHKEHKNHGNCNCCSCCKVCIDAIIIKEILVDWRTIFSTEINSLSILVFAYLLYPEFGLFIVTKYKERFYNKQEIVGNCDIIIQDAEGKMSNEKTPNLWNSYLWRHSEVWNNLNIASWFTKEIVNIIDYCRDNDISLDKQTRGRWLNQNLVGKYNMQGLENLYN